MLTFDVVDEDAPLFLSAKQRKGFGLHEVPPTRDELERFFLPVDQDRALIDRHRTDASRLGFALQLTTVRFLRKILEDPIMCRWWSWTTSRRS